MGRINLRLASSLLAAGIVLVLTLLPATRTLVERQFWVLSGTYDKRMGLDPSEYLGGYQTSVDDRIVLLINGYQQTPVEARVFQLAAEAEKQRKPALWAHVIRQAARTPLPTPPSTNWQKTDRFRREAIAQVELKAAQEGALLDPDNAFFPLAQAMALAKLSKWNELVPSLELAAKKSRFEDYTIDEFTRRTRFLKRLLKEPLPSDLGGDWAAIMLPHLSNYRQLAKSLNFIPGSANQLRAGLALARVGLLLQKNDQYRIVSMVGVGMIRGSIERLVTDSTFPNEKVDFKPSLNQVIAKSHALGLSDVESGWRKFQDWNPTSPNWDDAPPEDVYTEIHSLKGAQALFILCLVAVIGLAIWLSSHVEPSSKNIWVLTVALAGAITQWLLLEGAWYAGSFLYASLLTFTGFLLIRLPGKERFGYLIAALGAVCALVFAVLGWNLGVFGVLFTLWAIPFAFNRYLRKPLPQWVSIAVIAILFGICACLISNALQGTVLRDQTQLTATLSSLAAIATLVIPWIAALTMSLRKQNLSDSLKVMLIPLPLCALVTAGIFGWTVRQSYAREKTWAATTQRELPKSFQKILAEEGVITIDSTGRLSSD